MKVFADLRPIPDSPWFMVAKVDTNEILAETHYRAAVVIIFSGLFILLAAGLTAYGCRHARQFYIRTFTNRNVSNGRRRTVSDYSDIGDAVITTDTKGLAQQMNPVANSSQDGRSLKPKENPSRRCSTLCKRNLVRLYEPVHGFSPRELWWDWQTIP